MKNLHIVFTWIIILGSGILTCFAVRHNEWFVAIVFMIIAIVALLIYSINKSEKS